jgi:hypothetical protein
MKTTKEILREVKAELDARDRVIELLQEKLSRRPGRTAIRTDPNGERKEVPAWHMLASGEIKGRSS